MNKSCRSRLPTSVFGGKNSNDQKTSFFSIFELINSMQDLFSALGLRAPLEVATTFGEGWLDPLETCIRN